MPAYPAELPVPTLSALKASTAGIAARTLALAAELFARSLKLRYEGIAIASRMPRMMMTTRSSMRVKPLSSPASRCRIVLVMRKAPSIGDERSGPSSSTTSPTVGNPRWGDRCPFENTKGAVSRALRTSAVAPVLGAGVGDDVGAWAVLVPGLAADGAVHAVGDRGRRLDVQLRGDDRRVVRLQERDRHACVACRVAGAGVVGIEGLDCRERGANVGLGGRVVRTIPEAQVRGDRDREQDAQNDDDNEKFDEGETAFLTGQPLPDLASHTKSSFHGERTSGSPYIGRSPTLGEPSNG